MVFSPDRLICIQIKRGSALQQLHASVLVWVSLLGLLHCMKHTHTEADNLFVLDSPIQECVSWGRTRTRLATFLQVHGEATEGRLAEEAAEVFSEELAAALLCAERKHSDLSQR